MELLVYLGYAVYELLSEETDKGQLAPGDKPVTCQAEDAQILTSASLSGA